MQLTLFFLPYSETSPDLSRRLVQGYDEEAQDYEETHERSRRIERP